MRKYQVGDVLIDDEDGSRGVVIAVHGNRYDTEWTDSEGAKYWVNDLLSAAHTWRIEETDNRVKVGELMYGKTNHGDCQWGQVIRVDYETEHCDIRWLCNNGTITKIDTAYCLDHACTRIPGFERKG